MGLALNRLGRQPKLEQHRPAEYPKKPLRFLLSAVLDLRKVPPENVVPGSRPIL
jgi:hypothetical protein